MWIKWALENWRLLIGFALAGALFITGWHFGASNVQQNWEKERATQQADAMSAMKAHAEMIRKADEQHDKDNIAIVSLHTDVERLRNTVHLPTCSKDSDEAGRVLSASVDRLFGEFQERIGGLIQECDTLNSDAIRSNSITY
jgi:hypothetical protein